MNKTELLIMGSIAVAVAGTAFFSYRAIDNHTAGNEPVVCTAEAKLCPDGSYVGRTGLSCEFTPCAVASSTESGSNTDPIDTANTGTQESEGGAEVTSGVRGTVLLGPLCPVMRDPPEIGCEDQPYQTTVSAVRKRSSSVAFSGKTDATGRFELMLPPGEYQLSAKGGDMVPRCAPISVTVTKDTFSKAAISCDTGIR